MRTMTTVVAAMLATSLAFPTVKVAAAAPSWEQCNQEALKHNLVRLERGYDLFIKDCQAGRTAFVARERAGLSFEACETRAFALGMPHGQTGHVEYVRECMGKRPAGRRGF
jgi:hypothetical protein